MSKGGRTSGLGVVEVGRLDSLAQVGGLEGMGSLAEFLFQIRKRMSAQPVAIRVHDRTLCCLPRAVFPGLDSLSPQS